MRTPIIAGNWKMNTTIPEALDLVNTMRDELDAVRNVEKVICPPFIALYEVSKIIMGTSIKLGAQNMYFKDSGAFTGEVSPLMIRDICDFVIIGHSERRQYFCETDELVNSKLKAALEHGITPIVCVGESLEQMQGGTTKQHILGQIQNGLSGIDSIDKMVLAYEPIWAIGTGMAANGEMANETIGQIRTTIGKIWDAQVAERIRILYGGSVTSDNIREFIGQQEIDGALVGGACLKSDNFVGIVKQTTDLQSAQ